MQFAEPLASTPKRATPKVLQCPPEDWIEQASELLSRVWRPPALEYSVPYLRWQFSRPTSLPPVCCVIETDGRLDAFVAAIGNPIRLDGAPLEIYFSSHFCARPGTGGLNALSLVRSQGALLAATGIPVGSVTIPGSDGEKLLRVGAVGGYEVRKMATLAGYMAAPSPSGDERAERVDAASWAEAVAGFPVRPGMVETSLAADALAHYQEHPWTREFVVARAGARATAAAIAGAIRTTTPAGLQIVPCLVNVTASTGAGLAALVAYSARRFGSNLVSLPAAGHLPPDVLAQAHARRARSQFNWNVFGRPGHILSGVREASIEIV